MRVFGITIHKNITAAILLLGLSWLIYGSSLSNGFMMDDFPTLINQPKVQSLKFLTDVFSFNFGAGDLHYRPLYQVVNIYLYHFFGENPKAYHAFCILVFSLYCFLLFVLTNMLTANVSLAFLASSLFCVHPINGMVVNYITSYVISISGVFFILSLVAMLQFLETRRNFSYLLSVMAYAMGLLFYEQMIMLPVYLSFLLYGAKKLRLKQTFLLVLPHMVTAAVLLLFLISRSHVVSHFTLSQMSFVARIASWVELIGWYLSKLVFPYAIVLIWSIEPARNFLFFKALVFAGLLGSAIWVGVKYGRKDMRVFSLVWFFLGTLPIFLTMFIRPGLGLVLEPHWFFFASFGYFLFLAMALLSLKEKIHFRIWGMLILCLLLFYAVEAHGYNPAWKSDETYSRYWIQVNPQNNLAKYNLIMSYIRESLYDKALSECRTLLQDRYYGPEAASIMGLVYGLKQDFTQSENYFLEAIRKSLYDSTVQFSYINLAVTYILQNKLSRAEELLDEAYGRFPHSSEILLHLVRLYLLEGKTAQGSALLAELIQKFPDDQNVQPLINELLVKKNVAAP